MRFRRSPRPVAGAGRATGESGDPWSRTGARLRSSKVLHEEGRLSRLPCQACGYPTLSSLGAYEICSVCHWEDDGTTRETPDTESSANQGMTLRQAATLVDSSGVALPAGDARTAPEYFEPEVVQRRSELAVALQLVLETRGSEQAILEADAADSRLTEALYGRWM